MKITIPFREDFRERMLNGHKSATTRTQCYGEPGDTFEAWGRQFTITSIQRVHLHTVYNEWYAQEGFTSPEDFKAIWQQIHPRNGYNANQVVWLHHFQLDDLIAQNA